MSSDSEIELTPEILAAVCKKFGHSPELIGQLLVHPPINQYRCRICGAKGAQNTEPYPIRWEGAR